MPVDKGKIARLRAEIRSLQPRLAKVDRLIALATPAFVLQPLTVQVSVYYSLISLLLLIVSLLLLIIAIILVSIYHFISF